MIRHLILPLIAGMLALFATGYALYVQRPEADVPPPVPPPTTPFGNTVAGAGMVEPSTEASGTAAIAVGSQVAGVVTRIAKRIGDEVKAGDLLLELDSRAAAAELAARKAALVAARAQLVKLQKQPRPEEVPVSEAQVEAADANARMLLDQRDRNRRLIGKAGVAEQDLVASERAYDAAAAQLALARASLALLKAGAWEYDIAIADAGVKQAEAQVAQAQTALELLQVCAPVSGTILQVNVRPGEYVATFGTQSLILMGPLTPLHVRVNIDEEDIPRLKLHAPARAKLRGDASQAELPLRFVRLEPYVVPKVSLTGVNTERVDTRVVQVIYAIDPEHPLVRDHKVLVGQLVDVFIDTSSPGVSGNPAAPRPPQQKSATRHP